MSQEYRMPKGVVFSLQVMTCERADGTIELAAQRGGTVFVAAGPTWSEAYFALKAKMARG